MSLGRGKALERRTPLRNKPPRERACPRKALQDQRQPRARKGPIPARSYRQRRAPTATPEEKAHIEGVAEMECLASEADGVRQIGRTCIHHIREGYKTGQRASHWEILPLCEGSHQGMRDNTRLAFHKARRTWVLKYGNEIKLLEKVLARLGLTLEDLPRLRGSEPPWWKKYLNGDYDEETVDQETRNILTQEHS